MTFALSATAATVPALLLVWYFYSSESDPVPRKVLLTVFWLGLLGVLPVLIVQVPLLAILGSVSVPYDSLLRTNVSAYLRGAARAFLVVAPTEELPTFLILTLYCAQRHRMRDPVDGMTYGAIASLGFATVENIGYCYTLGLTSALARGFSAVPCHAFFGAIMGYYVGRAKQRPSQRLAYLTKSLLVPVFFHGLYDFPGLTILAQGDIGVIRELSEADLAQMLLALILMPGVLTGMWLWTLALNRRVRNERNQRMSPSRQEPSAPASTKPMEEAAEAVVSAGGN